METLVTVSPAIDFRIVQNHALMAVVSNYGEVAINWAAVDKAASDPCFNEMQAYARLMVAIRDGTWKPI